MQKGSNISTLIDDISFVQAKLEEFPDPRSYECCFCIGLTGSGKSSFICYICGKQMTFTKQLGRFNIKHIHREGQPAIGNSGSSCTSITDVYPMSENLILYDPPGFLDTKGPHQEVINCYCNAKMFKIGSRAKILIMVEVSSIFSARGEAFVKIARKLKELFQNDFAQIINSCLLVVSKVNLHQLSDADIKKNIEDISLKNKSLGPEGQMLCKTLVRMNRIICMPTPDFIDINFIRSLRQIVQELPSVHITHEPNIALTAEAKIHLENLLYFLNKEKSSLLKDICCEMQENVRKKYMENSTASKIEELLLGLKEAKSVMKLSEIGVNFSNKLKDLTIKLNLRRQFFEELQKWISQIQFCLTVFSNIRYQIRIFEVLGGKIDFLIKELEKQLLNIAKKEQVQQMNKKQTQIIAQQQRMQKVELEKYRKEMLEKEFAMKREAEEKNRNLQMQMMQLNYNHALEMNKLQYQLQIEKARRPSILEKIFDGILGYIFKK